MYNIDLIVAIIIAYLIGSISSAIIVCKILRLPDPRKQGSRNPGATNVLRIGGKKAALLTLAGDLLKGLIPVLVAKWLNLPPIIVASVMIAAFIGHLYPAYFRFEGGKGIATALGGLLALSWPAGVCFILVWLIVAILSRYSSLASLIASLLAPLFVYFFTDQWIYVLATCVMVICIIYRHRENIKKLLSGKENKLGKKIKV